jgi:hypothetical protein
MRKIDGQKFIQNLALSLLIIPFVLRLLPNINWEAYFAVGILILFLCIFVQKK